MWGRNPGRSGRELARREATSGIKEAVLQQLIQHLLACHEQCSGTTLYDIVTLSIEDVETLQALLDAEQGEYQRPPITRQRPTRDAPRPEQGSPAHVASGETVETRERQRPSASDHPTAAHQQEEESGRERGHDERHVVQFMRRHRAGDALRMASCVLFATIWCG